MTTQLFSRDRDQSDFPKMTIWGVFLLIMGIPELRAFQKQPTDVAKPFSLTRYAVIIFLTGVLASTLELSVL